MNIAMMTNTYLPMVGGLERSVEIFSNEYRKRGHRVLIITPEFPDMPEKEEGVIRLPAIKNFHHSEYSVALHIPKTLKKELYKFKPDIIHSHFPYLIGVGALRIARRLKIPLVFTHHSMYEKYTHYIPGDSLALKRFASAFSIGYANLCDWIISPSQSLVQVLKQRGVKKPVTCIPTGIHVENYAWGNGEAIRRKFHIPAQAFVITYIGRIEREKSVDFLAEVISQYLQQHNDAYFMLTGKGSKTEEVLDVFKRRGVASRVRATGVMLNQQLIDTYHAADVFAFASQTETQGIVLAEAMAAGLPIIAVDALGPHDIIKDKYNGRLLPTPDKNDFLAALSWLHHLNENERLALKHHAKETAQFYSIDTCTGRILDLYEQVLKHKQSYYKDRANTWHSIMKKFKVEWDIMMNLARAAGSALKPKTAYSEEFE